MARKQTELRPISTRIAEGLRRRLAASAKKNGRSMNSEINARLVTSYVFDDAFKTPELKTLGIRMSFAFKNAGDARAYAKKLRGDWTLDGECFRAGLYGVITTLLDHLPESREEDLAAEVESLRNRLVATEINKETKP